MDAYKDSVADGVVGNQHKRGVSGSREIGPIMVHDVVTIAPENTLYETARIMGEKHVGSLIVVK